MPWLKASRKDSSVFHSQIRGLRQGRHLWKYFAAKYFSLPMVFAANYFRWQLFSLPIIFRCWLLSLQICFAASYFWCQLLFVANCFSLPFFFLLPIVLDANYFLMPIIFRCQLFFAANYFSMPIIFMLIIFCCQLFFAANFFSMPIFFCCQLSFVANKKYAEIVMVIFFMHRCQRHMIVVRTRSNIDKNYETSTTAFTSKAARLLVMVGMGRDGLVFLRIFSSDFALRVRVSWKIHHFTFYEYTSFQFVNTHIYVKVGSTSRVY